MKEREIVREELVEGIRRWNKYKEKFHHSIWEGFSPPIGVREDGTILHCDSKIWSFLKETDGLGIEYISRQLHIFLRNDLLKTISEQEKKFRK